ncbi:MAG TPA: EAL domain-containing protein [Anaeromyxobacter sp.]|nr:EAL domain-containing protein [Anaeromyxobacter sp.]
MTVGAASGTLETVLASMPSPGSDLAPAPFDLFCGHDRLPTPGRLDLNEVRRLLDEGRFWTEYQPLVHAKTGRTAAFEALARFRHRDGRPVPPARVFSLLHADVGLLLRAELTLKLQQVERAPRAPLFVNLDPDCWTRAGDRYRNPFMALFLSAGVRVVVEVTEALATADVVRSQQMIAALRSRRIAFALDDIGTQNGLISFEAMAEAEVLKFDRTLIPRLRQPRCWALVSALVHMGRETGARTVLEGVETTADFVLARDLGIDLVQGYLFRDRARVAGR